MKYLSLSKKINVFQKLANSNLKSFAANSPKSIVDQLSSIFNNANVSDQNLMNALGKISLFNKTDPASLRAAADAADKAALNLSPFSHSNDINSVRSLSSALRDLANLSESNDSEVIDFSPVGNAFQGKIDSISAYPPIPTNVQSAIEKITVSKGVGLPIKIDGKLGPQTRSAINNYKKFIMNNPSASDKDAFSHALNLANSPQFQ